MGIKHLFQIIKEEAPNAIKEGEIKNHFGRKVAIVSLGHAPAGNGAVQLTVSRMRTDLDEPPEPLSVSIF